MADASANPNASASPEPTAGAAPPPLVVPFAAVEPGHAGLCGGKGHTLGTLFRQGFPVPDGFCITTEAMRRFIDEGGLAERLDAIAAHATQGGLEAQQSWAFLGETRDLILRTEIPAALREEIQRAYEDGLGARVVAVRSSGTKEDLEGASFAGQYESFLNVRGLRFLEDAIRGCWASIWKNRVLLYTGKQLGGASDLAMAVVVQVLVKAEAAGVLFTVNPLTGLDREMLVEATLGLGETLVSGRINPDRHVLATRTGEVLREELAAKSKRLRAMMSRNSRGESVEGIADEEEAIPEGEQRAPAVTGEVLAELAAIGRRVQAFSGRPMDVEWALEKGRLHIVQARPITHLAFTADVGEWTNANFKDGGVASDVCTPLMASLYDRIFSSTMQTWFETLRLIPRGAPIDWLQVFYAKPYWNVGAVKRVLLERLPGFVEGDFDDDLGVERAYVGAGRRTPWSLGLIVRALPILFAVRRAYAERLELARAFVQPFLREYEEIDAIDLDALPRERLVEVYARVLDDLHPRVESAYFLTVYALSNSKTDFKVLFDQVNRAAGGTLSYLDLISGLKDVAHLRPYKELYGVIRDARAAGRAPDLSGFLARWKYHSTRELDLRVPRWGEDPAYVEDTARQYADAALEDPAAIEARQRERFEAERAKLMAVLSRPSLLVRPLLRWRFRKGLRRIRDYAWWREELRDCSTRCYWLVRKLTLAMGRRLAAEGAIAEAGHLFLLPYQQGLALAKGALERAAAQAEVAWGAEYLASFRAFDNPNEIGAARRFDEVGARDAAAGAGAAGALKGVPGASGTARGRVKVVTRLDEASKVERGDVLVTVFTDPGWTPLLSLVGALVTETGGLLSHAAVISREYGIPAVLACAGATRALVDGEEVVVDGASGTVTRVGAAPAAIAIATAGAGAGPPPGAEPSTAA